jgi:hypothetical protein
MICALYTNTVVIAGPKNVVDVLVLAADLAFAVTELLHFDLQAHFG